MWIRGGGSTLNLLACAFALFACWLVASLALLCLAAFLCSLLCLLRLVSVWGGLGGLAPPPSLTASRALLCFAVVCLASLSFALLCAPLIRLRCLPACFALLDFAVSLSSFCLLASSLSCACLLPACSVPRNDVSTARI